MKSRLIFPLNSKYIKIDKRGHTVVSNFTGLSWCVPPCLIKEQRAPFESCITSVPSCRSKEEVGKKRYLINRKRFQYSFPSQKDLADSHGPTSPLRPGELLHHRRDQHR